MTESAAVVPDPLTAADRIAAVLASPRTVLPGGYQGDGRRWPQSLAGGAAGIALLHVERARTGHGDWATARAWLAEAASGSISAASNARLFFGAPAVAFVANIAAKATGHYRRALAALDDATTCATRTAIAAARARMDSDQYPELREFDLIRGLAGLAAYHLAAHPEHEITSSTLTALARLTDPLPGTPKGLPSWWTDSSPHGDISPDYPGGHGNFGMSHGISGVLAVLSLGILRGVQAPGADEAARRICGWTDQWRHGDEAAPWWPGVITTTQSESGHVAQELRPRPSWCYGVAGTARAQQLAGLALGDPARRRTADAAILSVLRDPAELGRLPETGLCHGTAGLLQAAWRMADDSPASGIHRELPHLTARLAAQLTACQDGNPELLDGMAGTALALHTATTGSPPGPCWDAFLAYA